MKPIPAFISASKKTCPNKPVFFGFVQKSENAQNRQKTAGKKNTETHDKGWGGKTRRRRQSEFSGG
jgi:hypothetical protein